MATLTVTSVVRTGVAETLTAAAGGGDKFLPSKDTFFVVNNGGGGAITVTFASTNTSYGLAVADAVSSPTVGAGERRIFGPFPAEVFANASDGLCDVTYSGVTSVTVNPFKLAQP
jgi:hypothetical protein